MSLSRKAKNRAVTLTCDPCRFSGKTAIPAVKYCQDCHGHFCQSCATGHLKSYTTRYHVFMDLKEKNHKKAGRKKASHRCNEHDADFVSYCESHDVVCCHVCVTSGHRACSKVIPLSDATFGTRAVKLSKELESNIKKLQTQFEEVKTAKVDYIKAVEHQDTAFLAAVKGFRRTINAILNRLEDALIRDKNKVLKEKLDLISGHVRTFDLADQVLKDAYRQLDVSLHNNDTDMFLNAKHVQDIVTEYTDVYQKLKETPDKGHLRFEPELKIQQMLNSYPQLGSVSTDALALSVKTSSSGSVLSSRRSSVQTFSKKPDFTKDVYIRAKTDKNPCYITGAGFLPDGRVVLADDSNKSVKLLGNDCKVLACYEHEAAPRDVTAISLSEVAVTLPDEKCIQIFEVATESLEKKKKLVLNMECYGITFHETVIYVTSGWSPEKEVQVIEPSGKVIQRMKLPNSVFKYPLYITIDPLSDVIFVTDYMHGVIALDMSGDVLYKYEDRRQARGYYKGVTLTLPGQILACTWQSQGICKLNPEGKGMDSVITWPAKERRKPVAIAYAFNNKKLLVTYCGDKRDFVSFYMLH